MSASKQQQQQQQGGALVRQPIRLTVLRRDSTLMDHVFQHTPIRIGRLSDNDIVLPFDFVSRYHCEIRFDGQQWVAVDLGSKNGLMLDAATKAQEVRLEDGSEFGIQEVTIKLAFEMIDEKTGFGPINEADTVIGAPTGVVDAPPAFARAAPSNTQAQARTVPYPTVGRGRLSPEPLSAREPAPAPAPAAAPPRQDRSHEPAPQAPPPRSKSFSREKISRTDHTPISEVSDAHAPMLNIDQEQILFSSHPMIHQAREKAIQMIVLWHDIVIDAREFGVGTSIQWDWLGETLDLGAVKSEKTAVNVPSGCEAIGPGSKPGTISVSLSQPNAFRLDEVTRVSFRYVPKSRDLAPASFLPNKQMIDPLLVSTAIHGAAIFSAVLAPKPAHEKARQEPERFAVINIAPSPTPIAMMPTPTPTPLPPKPTPTPIEIVEKPSPTPKPKKVVKKIEKPKPPPPAPEPKPEPKVVKAPPVEKAPVVVKAPPKPPPPAFNAKAVGALKMLDLMKAGPAVGVANIEKIQVSRVPATTAASRDSVETGDMMSKLDQSAKAQDRDSMSGVAVGGKASGSYQTAGLGKAGSGKVRGSVIGGAKYSDIGKNEGLSREQVMKVVAANQAKIQACYERALMGNSDLVGRADFEWEISAKGKVTSVNVKETTIKNGGELLECVRGVFSGMQFPEAKNGESTTPTIGLPFGRL